MNSELDVKVKIMTLNVYVEVENDNFSVSSVIHRVYLLVQEIT